MLEIVPGFPEDVVGIRAVGRISRKDYDEVLVPACKAVFEKHGKARFYYELGTAFTGMDAGAMWEDFTFGMGHLMQWAQVVLVTDTAWIAHAVNAFGFLMPCPVKVFPVSETAAARALLAR